MASQLTMPSKQKGLNLTDTVPDFGPRGNGYGLAHRGDDDDDDLGFRAPAITRSYGAHNFRINRCKKVTFWF